MRVFFAISIIVVALTVAGIVLAEQKLSTETEAQLESKVEQQLAALAHTREVRQSVLISICDSLARKPRIHAALEDDALDLLYPSAQQELRQVLRELDGPSALPPGLRSAALKALFYRFLDQNGRLIPPDPALNAGVVGPAEWTYLELPEISMQPLNGYLVDPEPGAAKPLEVYTIPIVSTASFRPIAALVVGFSFAEAVVNPPDFELMRVFRQGAVVCLPESFPADAQARAAVSRVSAQAGSSSQEVLLGGVPHRVLVRTLEQSAPYPPAEEIYLANLSGLETKRGELRRYVILAGVSVLAVALLLVRLLSHRLADPVEALAKASDEEHEERLRVETALDQTSRELARTARFSADASHQLKTPISVLRVGLEEILEDPKLSNQLHAEVVALIQQTHRLNTVIDDLLLLARLDAGHLRLRFAPISLHHLLAGLLDDFNILRNPLELTVETSLGAAHTVFGERRYLLLILQNLLENARKYNRLGGRIRIAVETVGETVSIHFGNTGEGIPKSAQTHIFERFNRGAMAEQVPGYGLGLNLARDLARLHRGDLQLVASGDDWTAFALLLPLRMPSPQKEASAAT